MYTHVHVLWSNCPSETKVNPPHRQRLEKPWPKQSQADFSLAAAFFRRTVGSFSQELFFISLGEAQARAGRGHEYHISPGGQLQLVAKTFQMAFLIQLSPGAQYQPPASVPSAPALLWASAASSKSSLRRNQSSVHDLHGRVFHMGLDSTQCDFSFPLSLIQIGTQAFLVDHSCPDVAIFFYISVFSSSSRFFFFCYLKRTHLSLYPLLIVTNQCYLCLRVLVPARYYIKHCYAHNVKTCGSNLILFYYLYYYI